MYQSPNSYVRPAEPAWPDVPEYQPFGGRYSTAQVDSGKRWRRRLLVGALVASFGGGVAARPALERTFRDVAAKVDPHLGPVKWLYGKVMGTPVAKPTAPAAPIAAGAPAAPARPSLVPLPGGPAAPGAPPAPAAGATPAPPPAPAAPVPPPAPASGAQAAPAAPASGAQAAPAASAPGAQAAPAASAPSLAAVAKRPPAPEARPAAPRATARSERAPARRTASAAPAPAPRKVAAAAAAKPAAKAEPAEEAAPAEGSDSLDSLIARAVGPKARARASAAAQTEDPSEAAKPAAAAAEPLARAQIVDTIKGQEAEIEACLAGLDGHEKGPADLRVTVAPGGKVTQVQVAGKFFATRVAGCLVKGLRAAQFPASGGMTFPYRYLVR